MNITPDLLFYPFEDGEWKQKFLIGGLLVAGSLMVPVLGLVLLVPLVGYMLEIARRTAEDGTPALPDWDDWGGLFRQGIKGLVVTFVYMLLPILLFCCALVLMLAVIPISLTGDEAAIVSASLFGQFAGLFVLGVAMIPLLALTFLALIALARLAVTGELRDAFDFGEVWALAQRGFRPFLLALIIVSGFSYLVSFVYVALIYSLVLLCLAPVVTAALGFYTAVLYGALSGLAYRTAGAAQPSAPLPAAEA